MGIKVVNRYTHTPTSRDVYIGRGSKWGNPYRIGADGTRDQVIEKYFEYILRKPELIGALDELRNKNLVCFCAPQRCHGDVLKLLCEGIEEGV